MYAQLFIQLPEVRIPEVFNKPNSFSFSFHFSATFFVHPSPTWFVFTVCDTILVGLLMMK